MRRFVKLLALLLALSLVAAACDDDDDNGNGAGDNGGTDAPTTPTGEPIKIGMMSPVNSETISLPDGPRAAQIAVRAINDEGGVQGRPLELVHCDDRDNPEEAALCARRLLEEEDVVLVTAAFGRQMAALYPVLDATDKINLFSIPVVPEDFQNERSFPIGIGTQALTGYGGLVDADEVAKVAVARTDSASGEFIYSLTAPVFEAKGIETVDIPVDPTATDLQPIALRIRQEGADAVVLGVTVDKAVLLIRAATSLGLDVTWLTNSGSLTQPAISELAGAGVEPVIALAYAIDPELPRRVQYLDEIERYGDEVGIEDTVADTQMNSWLAVHLVAEVFEQVDTIDSASVRAYMEQQTAFETGLTNTIDFTSPVSEQFPRLFNKWVIEGAIRDGELVQTGTDWVSGI